MDAADPDGGRDDELPHGRLPDDELPDDQLLRTARCVAVHGLGREGRSVVTDLARTNPSARVLVLEDGRPTAGDREFVSDHDAEVVEGAETGVARLQGVDLVVRSPGVPLTHPVQRAARAAGLPVTTALNLFFARHRPRNVVAVTGTKGKSTTTTLLGHLLDEAGRTVRVAGNVGLSVLDLEVAPGDLDHLVLELSSYQLADLRASLHIGVWLNLHRDHHAWHGGAATYARHKGRIVQLAETLVANADDDAVMARAGRHPDLVGFDATVDPVRVGATSLPRRELVTALAASRLVGTHNLANLAATLAVGDRLGLQPRDLLSGLATFQPLPHRLEVVHDDGRRWIDDSIATIPEATVAALDAFPETPVTLLAGGFDRDQDHAPLVAAVSARASSHVAVRVVALPVTGRRLARELTTRDPRVDVDVVDDLAAAVATADRATRDGAVVLLSPAAASFNQFHSFEERGRRFASLARAVRD